VKLFLVEKSSKFDLTALSEFGEIVYISNDYLNPFSVDYCLKEVQKGLESFNCTEDFLVLTGNLVLVSYMMMVAYEKFGTFKTLMFDAKQSNYKERIVCRLKHNRKDTN